MTDDLTMVAGLARSFRVLCSMAERLKAEMPAGPPGHGSWSEWIVAEFGEDPLYLAIFDDVPVETVEAGPTRTASPARALVSAGTSSRRREIPTFFKTGAKR